MTEMNSSSPGLKEDILIEAVRAIKNQRQRPSLDRICRWLRFHKQVRRLETAVVATALETVVAKGALRKDVKEGSEAYRELKSTTRERRTGVKLSIASAICQCIQQFGGSEGLALDRICERVTKMVVFQDMDPLVLKYHVRVHCLKAVKRGKLLREGRCYRLVRSGQLRWNADDKRSDVDLSFLVDRAVTNKRPVTPIEICSLCLDSDEKNRSEAAEELIYCVECGRGGHPSCLKFSSSLTEKVKTMKWQCIECKRCSVCADSSRGHLMLFCDSCDRGFHMDCCRPPIRKRPRGIWICCICDYEMDHNNALRCHGNSVHQSGGSKRKCVNGAIRKSGSNRSGSFPIKRRNSLTNSSSDFGSDDSNFENNESAAQTLPFPVSKDDEDCYRMAQLKVSQKLLQEHQLWSSDGATLPETMKRTGPLGIEFGKYEVMTWYSSPYPDGYTKLNKLYICEYCLRYMESRTILERHLIKCLLLRPPGDEIYRDGNLSVFEVDGNVAQIYCQNLCLLAKLFLDHKTLYYDVEPFLFYILTLNDSDGCHLVGYFSKEKYCAQKYNLSCIMVLPQYQRHGYGRLLIDFSYLLSRVEGRTGTPEKPLSDLGQLTYQSYWKEAITAYLEKHINQTVTIKGIGDGTGICEQDVVAMLQLLNLLVPVDQNRLAIVMDGVVAAKPVRPSEDKSRSGRTVLDPGRLQWKPFVSRSMIQTEESETFQELKQLSRLVDDIRDNRRRAEMLSPSIRLSRSSSLCSPPRKRGRMSPIQLGNGSCDSDQRTGLWRSKSETVGSSPVEALPLTCSTPLTSERLGLWRTRRATIVGLSPVPDKQSAACVDSEALLDSLKTGADGKWTDCSPGSFTSNAPSDLTKPGRQRKKRGWVKGRKRGTRPKDLSTDLESAETSDATTGRDHDLRNESLVIVIHSSVEQVVNVSPEDQTSNATAHEKLSPQDAETTEIYEIDRKVSAVEKRKAEVVVVDSSMEVEKPGKENILNCDEDSLRVLDSSAEIMRNAVSVASGDLFDVQSYSRVESNSRDLDRDVTFEQSSVMSDLQEVRTAVYPPVEQSRAAKMLNSLMELKEDDDEVVDDISQEKENVKYQVVDDTGQREEETSERKCQVVDDTSQQEMTPVDVKCQNVTDLSQNEVTTSQQEVPRNDKKCSFVVESTNSDVGVADDQGISEDFRYCDSLPDNNKDANSKRTELPQITSTNKFDLFSYDTDSFGGDTDNGNIGSGDGSTDDVGPIIIARRERLSTGSNECGPLLKDGKTSKSSLLHTNKNISAMKRDSIKRENGKYCQAVFLPGCWNRDLCTADDSKLEILNGCLPDCSSTNNVKSRVEIDENEEVGRGDGNARKSVVEMDCALNGNKDIAENSRFLMVEVDCVANSIELKELGENARNAMAETDCVLNGNTEIKERAEILRKSMVTVECVLNGNKEHKELAENYSRNSMLEADCVPNGNIELKEDGERTRKSADSPECLETLAVDSLTYYPNCKVAKSELVTPVCPVINTDTNGVEKDLVPDWSDSVIAKKIKTIELSNCCLKSVDDR